MPTPQMQAWLDRWQLVNELEEEELRNTPPEVRLRQLEALRSAIETFGWKAPLEEGLEEVRQRWQRIKDKYGVRSN